MALDKATLNQLRRYAAAFRDARDRAANESDTVMFIVKFMEDVLGWDSFKGEISKEAAIKDRYCDIALKIEGVIQLLVECKSAGLKELSEKHIEQAENYASRAGINWVVLTNGIEWKLFHLTFGENEGIVHDLVFEVQLADDGTSDMEPVWDKLSLLTRAAVAEGEIESFWAQRKLLSPASVVRALFSETVLMSARRELNRNSSVRLEIEDVFTAVRDVLSREALLQAGDIGISKRRKRRRRPTKPTAEESSPAAADTPATGVTTGAPPETPPATLVQPTVAQQPQ